MKQARLSRLYRVEGRVQGVGFRFFVERAATELGITGYVRNLSDGRVEVYAAGTEEQLRQLRQQLESGPPGSRVRGVAEQPAPREDCPDFSIRYGF